MAVTGASGAVYAREFARLASRAGVEVHGLVSEAGAKVLELELGLVAEDLTGVSRWFDVRDFTAPMASGSAAYDAMAVVPCTMGTLAAIAGGHSINLIHRAADVMLKERRRLVLAVRETPFNASHIRNMALATEAGAVVCPAMPAFYHRPATLDEMAADFAARVAVLAGVDGVPLRRWHG